ncbi:MAG: hypothetical protein RR672_08095, partial [Raoultibacter sp.]
GDRQMIMLEEPYVSDVLIDWLETSKHPVLDNAMARRIAESRAIALCPEQEAIDRIEGGERLYTSSENALAWLSEHIVQQKSLQHFPSLISSYRLSLNRLLDFAALVCTRLPMRLIGLQRLQT